MKGVPVLQPGVERALPPPPPELGSRGDINSDKREWEQWEGNKEEEGMGEGRKRLEKHREMFQPCCIF